MSLKRALFASSAALLLIIPASIALAQRQDPWAVSAIVEQAPMAEAESNRKSDEAAKATVDELLAREPTLAEAAKRRPPDAKAKAEAERRTAYEARVVAEKAKEDVQAAHRRAIADQIKAHEDAKIAALKAKQEANVNFGIAKSNSVKTVDAKAIDLKTNSAISSHAPSSNAKPGNDKSIVGKPAPSAEKRIAKTIATEPEKVIPRMPSPQ